MKLRHILLEYNDELDIDNFVNDLKVNIINATKTIEKKQNEAVVISALGIILSTPFLIKIIGNTISKIQKKISGTSNIGDSIQHFAEKSHHLLEKPFKMLAATFTDDPAKRELFAKSMIAGILVILLVSSGLSIAKFMQTSQYKSSALYSMKSVIKGKEIREMIPELAAYIKELMKS